ncbi:hypothetical protein [Comamonas jiangduensis]|uniref:hypothetical protein n=2 Tax=Comamonas jiangduensis TaxID=1194168 RepID=UPI003BF86898
MSSNRFTRAMTRALRAIDEDLTEISKISGLTNQDRWHLSETRKICERLIDNSDQLKTSVRSPAPRHTNIAKAKATAAAPAAPVKASATPTQQEEAPKAQGDKTTKQMLRDLFPNHGQPWDTTALSILHNAITVAKGNQHRLDVPALSSTLGRSPYSVATKAVLEGYGDDKWAQSYRHQPQPANTAEQRPAQ